MKKLIAVLTVILIIIALPLNIHAVENSEVLESSNSETSLPESSALESSVPESSVPESSVPESSVSEISDSSQSLESSTESTPSEPESSISETSEPSNTESSTEPSEASAEESTPTESSVIIPESSQPTSSNVTDPFGLFAGIVPHTDAPSPQDSTPAQTSAQEESFVEETTSVPKETASIPTVDESRWLTSAGSTPIPVTADDSDILTGIILWSVIGLAITTVFIILLNIKGTGRSSRKNRYTSTPIQQRTAYSSRKYDR